MPYTNTVKKAPKRLSALLNTFFVLLVFCFCYSAHANISSNSVSQADTSSAENDSPQDAFLFDSKKDKKKGLFKVSDKAPAGFESLLEAQTTSVDVYYGSVFLLSTLATYEDSEITFDQPQAIIDQLHNLRFPEKILEQISTTLDTNDDLVCHAANLDQCGFIEPEVIAVIFNEGRFRVDLFINPSMLTVQGFSFNKYLEPPSTGFSSINNFSIFSSHNEGQNQYSIAADQMFSYKDLNFQAAWYVSENQGDLSQRLNNVFLEKNGLSTHYRAGLFTGDSTFFSFLPTFEIFGASIASNLKARIDLDYARATPIELYLPTRSQVKLFKGEQFLGSRYYNPGLQQINTTDLPNGAYDLRLVIVDSRGTEKVEEQFFVKSTSLAPIDQDLYFIEVGALADREQDNFLPDAGDEPLFSAGYSKRLSHSLGLSLGTILTKEEQVAELGLLYIHPFFEIEPKVFSNNNNSQGAALTGRSRFKKLSQYFELRQFWKGDDDIQGDDQEMPNLAPNRDLKQYIFGLAFPLFNGSANMRFDKSEEDKKDKLSFAYNKALPWEFSLGRINLRSEYNKTNEGNAYQISLALRYSKNDFSHSAETAYAKSEKDSQSRLSYSGSWNDNGRFDPEVNTSWYTQINEEEKLLGLSGSFRNGIGSVEASANVRDQENGNNNTSFSTRWHTSIASENSKFALGGNQSSESAVIVNINGTDAKNKYNVLVDGVKAATVRGGKSTVIALPAYKNYNIEVVDKSDNFTEFDKTQQKVTLYPGNTKHMSWRARSLVVLFAEIEYIDSNCSKAQPQSACRKPLAEARVTNLDEYSTTDLDGNIQVEAYSDMTSLEFATESLKCKVDLSALNFDDSVLYVEEPLLCQS